MTKILVIEDAETLRNSVVDMLHYEGYEVISAANGKEGVALALEHLPNIIICDIMMSELDGYGVLEQLRADARTTTTPFIFLTARTDRNDWRIGMDQGADDYLTKPFDSNELIKCIQSRLNKYATHEIIAQNKMKQLSESISTALPHELRTPLNAIIGFSDLLISQAHDITSEQIIEYAQHINTAAYRLHHLAENYLSFVKTQVLRASPKANATIQNNITHYPCAIIGTQATNKASFYNRLADISFTETLDAPVRISEEDLNKIVEEAIDNAFKFSKPGRPITITTKIDDHYFVISIQDHGHGMSQEQISNIGAYMQFDRPIQEQQGNGLGLVIIREFLALYGGKLEIQSKPSQGTNLIIKLLVAKENIV